MELLALVKEKGKKGEFCKSAALALYYSLTFKLYFQQCIFAVPG